MASVVLPAWARPGHPVVVNETRHWRRSRVWRGVRFVLWGGTLSFVLVPALCGLSAGLQSSYGHPVEAILTGGATFAFGLAAISYLAHLLNALSASLLGATLIARERETNSWVFLRLTTLTSLEIVGAKLAALLYTLARPVHLVLLLRVLALAAAGLTAWLAAAFYGVSWAAVRGAYDGLLLTPLDGLILPVIIVVGLPLGLASWLAEPYFGVLYNGAVGLAAGTLARSRGLGVVLVVAAHFVIGLGVYMPAQQLGSLVLIGLVSRSPDVGPWLALLTILLPMLAVAALQVGVLVFALALALLRVERLSD